MNHLRNINRLQNRYFVMRHGQSEANILDIIACNPLTAIENYGLTLMGREQALDSITQSSSKFNNEVILISSRFKRAKETAEIVQKCLGIEKIIFNDKLSERGFGIYDLTPIENYHKTIELDKLDSNNKHGEVESVEEVLDRITSFILNLENAYKDKLFLLVSHGDVLQVLQTAFAKIESKKFRDIKYFENAEIRELRMNSELDLKL